MTTLPTSSRVWRLTVAALALVVVVVLVMGMVVRAATT